MASEQTKSNTDSDGEIITIRQINQLLRDDYLCCPPYSSTNGEWVSEFYEILKQGKKDQLKYHVTKDVIHPWRRAYQSTYHYRELEIFKPFIYILDVATISFLENNWIASYLSLIPVVEGVLTQWQSELGITLNRGQGIKLLCEKLFEQATVGYDHSNKFYQYLKTQCDFVLDVLKNDFFEHGDNVLDKNPAQSFGRNIPLHMLNVPKWEEAGINSARVFLLLDLIANLYFRSQQDRYPQLASIFDLTFKRELHDKYFDLFKKCANDGLERGRINRLHNIIYKDI